MESEQADVGTRVKRMLATQLDIPEDRIEDDSLLVEQLGVDSFGMVELLFELEDQTGISIPDDDLPQIHTAGELVGYIEERLRNPPPEAPQAGEPGQ